MTIRVLEAEDVDQMHLLLESNWHPVASHHLLCLRKHVAAYSCMEVLPFVKLI